MNNFCFKYKQWYWFPIFLVNILIPSFSFIFRVIQSPDHSINLFLLVVWVVLLLPMMIIYIFSALREAKFAVNIMENSDSNFFRFFVGIILTFFSWNLTLAGIIPGLWDSNSSSEALKIYNYVAILLSLISSFISNVFLSMFEFKLNFDIFYSRYKDTLIPEIISIKDTRISKQLRSKR